VVLFPAEAIALPLFQSIQKGCKTLTISYSIDTERSLARGKEAGKQNTSFALQERAHLYFHFPIWVNVMKLVSFTCTST
jgi:hypothetical protein